MPKAAQLLLKADGVRRARATAEPADARTPQLNHALEAHGMTMGHVHRAIIAVFVVMLHVSLPVLAGNFECLTGFGNVGLAEAQGDGLDGAGLAVNGGVFCSGDSGRFAMSNRVGFSEFKSSEDTGDIGSQYWSLEVQLVATLVQRFHIYGMAGIGGYYSSLHPPPSGGNEHSLNGGYNAGIAIAFPIEDGPGIVLETIWHNPSGPGQDSFFTLTVGLGGI